MSVGIVVDGGVSLPEGGSSAPRIVPMGLTEEELTEEKEPGAGASGRGGPRRATTSAPTPGAFLEAIEASEEGEGVLVVTVSERLSASFLAARSAAALAAGGHEVELVESGTATVGEGLVAQAALRAAGRGEKLASVAEAARRAASGVRLLAQIADLEQLVRGGRVPAAVAATSRLTGLRPVIELRQGSIRLLRPAFGRAAAEARIVGGWRRSEVEGAALHLAALHGGDRAAASRLLEAVRRRVEPATSFLAMLSPVMLAHTGPAVSGIAWWWEVPG